MKKKTIWIVGPAIIVILFFLYFGKTEKERSIKVKPKSGAFTVSVVVNGEFDAENSVDINGPMGLQSIRIYSNIKIEDLVDEGTVVDSGDYIGSLDQTPVMNRLKEVEGNLEKLLSQINKSKIDSALDLRLARDQLVNQKYTIEENEIELANSKFEPPAVQRKIEINLEKAKRQYEQGKGNYKLKKDKHINTIQEAVIDYNKDKRLKEQIMDVMSEFRVRAPQSGMVIYAKSWSGKKKVPGSTISPWNPILATLPDLSTMQVKCFVNEIDISKIKVNQEAEITVDAFPDKILKGKVKKVANIGEELRNSAAHVFEVVLSVEGSDPDIRPAMTCKNRIITSVLDSVIFIPLECLHSTDSLVYVYSEGYKKVIETGLSNEDDIVVIKGLEADDEVYLSEPENGEKWDFEFYEK